MASSDQILNNELVENDFKNDEKNDDKNEAKIDVIDQSPKIEFEQDKIPNIFDGTKKEFSEEYVPRKLQMNFTLKRHSKLERIIDSLLEENKKFSIFDYFKKKCKSKSKRIILYGYALKNLQEILDIRNYLKSHLELNLIKQILFDEYQLKICDTISPVIGFKHMFEELDEYKNVKLSEYKKVEFNDFFDYVQIILSRKNLVDNKIFEYINKQLVAHS
jgi:hypothetical protein